MTKYDVLNEMATYYEAQARMFSHNCASLTAKEGYDIPFQESKDKVKLIRAMMKDVRFGADVMEPKQIKETIQALQCCREDPRNCAECPLLSQRKRRYNCIEFSKDMAVSALTQLLQNRTGEKIDANVRPLRAAKDPAPLRPWQLEQMEIDKQREGLL